MSAEEGVIVGLFAMLAGFFILILVIGIIMYILYAIGMFKIAKTLGREDMAFLAWIPIAQIFLLPLVVEDDVHEQIRGKFTLIFAISWIGSVLLSMAIPIFGVITLIVQIYGFHVLATRFSENALVHTIITIVTLGFAMPISIFLFRNREPLPKDEVFE